MKINCWEFVFGTCLYFLSLHGYFTFVDSNFFNPRANQRMEMTELFCLIVYVFYFVLKKKHQTCQKWAVNSTITYFLCQCKNCITCINLVTFYFFPLFSFFIPLKIWIMKHFILENVGIITCPTGIKMFLLILTLFLYV